MPAHRFWPLAIGISALLCLLCPIVSSGFAPGATEKVIYSFQGGNDGLFPLSELTLDGEGNLYGTAGSGGIYGNGAVFELKRTSNGWKQQIIYSFTGGGDTSPESGVVFDSAGNLYGITDGYYEQNIPARVFKLTPNDKGKWTETVLYIFSVGAYGPQDDLVVDSHGDLFGTLTAGGGSGCEFGCGIVFELIPTKVLPWREITLHSFTGAPDGAIPASGVVLDSSGNVYGTTVSGGLGKCTMGEMPGCGVIYELTSGSPGGWAETILYNFIRGRGLSVSPSRSLILEKPGLFLGTASFGGDGRGTVFEISQSQTGWDQEVLYRFYGAPDGDTPVGRLAVDTAGRLFGATYRGGRKGGGTVFQLESSKANGWRESVLHSFTGVNGDGLAPQAGLVSDGQGHLYGTTEYGGDGPKQCGGEESACGTVYEITLPDGKH